MNRRVRAKGRVRYVWVGLLLVACGGVVSKPQGGGESHFLERCVEDCSDGLECVAEVCTRGCLVGESSCADLEPTAVCTDQSIEPGAIAVCDIGCSSAGDCAGLGSGFGCAAGFCRKLVTEPSPEPPLDAGPGWSYPGQFSEELYNAAYGECRGVALLPLEDGVTWIEGPVSEFEATNGAIGDWTGRAISPWGDWDLVFSLRADGTYSARGPNEEHPALYWGSDLDSPLKRWALTGPSLRGAGGLIDVVHWDAGEGFHVSGHQGYLDCMHSDAELRRLRFEFWGDDSVGGPVVYDLWRL